MSSFPPYTMQIYPVTAMPEILTQTQVLNTGEQSFRCLGAGNSQHAYSYTAWLSGHKTQTYDLMMLKKFIFMGTNLM